MSTILYILLAIFIFGVLIAVHELGHFIAARACGVRVLEFAMGMGPLLWQRESKKGTLISLRALPIGGFCAMEGEDDASDDPAAFSNAAVWKRLIILVAGAGMNFLLGLVLVLVCLWGDLGELVSTPVIDSFMEGCPYVGEYGLQEGDEFLRINGQKVRFTNDVSAFLGESGGTADIVLLRDGQRVTLKDYPIVPVEYTDPATGESVMMYGLHFASRPAGVGTVLHYSWLTSLDFVRMVWMGLSDLVTGAVGMDQMSGVVGIVDLMADVGNAAPTVRDALLDILYLAAFIAVNLAVMNLLPLPALDGGRIFFLCVTWLIETVFRRRVNPKYENYINAAGLALLMALMVYVMFNDIFRIVAG